jgi:hypothetical protein
VLLMCDISTYHFVIAGTIKMRTSLVTLLLHYARLLVQQSRTNFYLITPLLAVLLTTGLGEGF